ncbi:MAG TPA: type II toxin-antitoxin system prevent-host-death family antitoxin [Beijerinckiaceae bacterium]|nr:type II toxin-antitoxin system prevent-host-death family antitoxin [Beijerinckiaceae bacterium]
MDDADQRVGLHGGDGALRGGGGDRLDQIAHLSELLDAVERGETIAITRHGRRIARLVPEADRRRQEIEEAITDMKALAKERREQFGPVSVEEIISSIHEGHKY